MTRSSAPGIRWPTSLAVAVDDDAWSSRTARTGPGSRSCSWCTWRGRPRRSVTSGGAVRLGRRRGCRCLRWRCGAAERHHRAAEARPSRRARRRRQLGHRAGDGVERGLALARPIPGTCAAALPARRDGSRPASRRAGRSGYCRVRQYFRRSSTRWTMSAETSSLTSFLSSSVDQMNGVLPSRGRGARSMYSCTGTPSAPSASVLELLLEAALGQAKSAGVSGTSSSLVCAVRRHTRSSSVVQSLSGVRVAVEREAFVQIVGAAARIVHEHRVHAAFHRQPAVLAGGVVGDAVLRPGRACRRRAPPARRCSSGTPSRSSGSAPAARWWSGPRTRSDGTRRSGRVPCGPPACRCGRRRSAARSESWPVKLAVEAWPPVFE